MSEFKRYWNEERETMPPGKRRRFIFEKLKHQLEYVYPGIPFYRELYDRHGVKPDDIRHLEDFTEKIPIVTKEMLRESQARHPPFGDFLGIDPADIFHVQGTSGTTGLPTVFGFSRKDWDMCSDVAAMLLWGAGVRPDDIVQLAFPMSLFVGGWGLLGGAQRLGATILPIGGGETRRHVDLMYHLESSVICATPSYCLHLLEAARQAGRDTPSSPFRIGVFGGEPGAGLPEIKRRLEDGWGMNAIDFGNSAEVHPPSNMECEARRGMHVYSDVVYTEVVAKDDPHALVPMGERGAIVYTSLWRESQPMIRYWPGDETVMSDDPCSCGRTYPRLPQGVLGRLDDMLIVRGVNLYPSAIEQALRDTPGTGTEFRVYTRKNGPFDDVRIEVERDADLADTGSDDKTAGLRRAAEEKVKAVTGVRIPVQVVASGSFPRAALKARRVIAEESEGPRGPGTSTS